MHGVAGVFLALKPIAGNVGEDHFAEAVLPGERLPDRQLRYRLRPHIGPEEPGAFLHRISLGRTAILGARARIDGVVIGLLDATPAFVHQPAVIVASDAGLLDESLGEILAPSPAMSVEQPQAAPHV